MGTIVKSPISVLTVGLLIGSLTLTNEVQGKIFTKCGLTLALIHLNVDRTFVGNWVCLVENESFKNTSKIRVKANGEMGVGLFQIKSGSWCTFKKKGGKCNIPCEKLIDDYIDDDVECAKKAIQELGFKSWEGWVRNCKGRPKATVMPNCPGV